jgi:hypothetical protein
MVPILVGVHAKNEAQATKYSIIHNHSTIHGAGLDLATELKLFDPDLLIHQAEYLDEKGENLGVIGDLNSILEALNASDENYDDSPDFQPSEEEQPRLDVKNPTICPKCGHEWTNG